MSETNRLYNEYELKKLPISTIAKLHARTQYAILHKLSKEYLINESWNDVKGWDGLKQFQKNMDMQSDDDYDDEEEEEEEDDDDDSDYTGSDDEESEADDESVISEESLEDCDDPNDSDYVDEEMDEDDDDDSSDYEDDEGDDEDEKEFDPYSIPQKVSALKKLIDSAKFFLYSQ
jgi:hypothetical protein